MPLAPHILIIDDDAAVHSMLRRYLTDEGFRVTDVADGSVIKTIIDLSTVDLVLLDLVMPGEDGFSIARSIRNRCEVPIIMLTGKGDLIDKVAGLEAGADDYIAKPFHLREVLARIRTVLRRAPKVSEAGRSAAEPTQSNSNRSILSFDGFSLDLAKRELLNRSGKVIELTTGEFELLKVLAMNANRVLDRDTLMDLVKGREWSAYDRSIDAQIVRLRRKIEANPAQPRLIKTVRGAGYIFSATIV